eukprot:CAMPEP_0197189188 /NCGR_PEP_ID=MMETSP1423-20130617/19319_1 /TAXON_ID=476441 /ORGANISM="Pseudo-nitzschia heimii, Strain UNC1101" /LENGTH=61 /DNA_ID=CAMNT_0042641239 /DNA_START=68 /DNA_END=250 /DNA_ORIENTATION=-
MRTRRSKKLTAAASDGTEIDIDIENETTKIENETAKIETMTVDSSGNGGGGADDDDDDDDD